MSQKLTTIGVVLLLLICICAVEQVSVHAITGKALKETAEITDLIFEQRLDAAKEKTHALDMAWEKSAAFLETMVDHSSTDDVRYALSRLTAALESGDYAAAMIYAGELEGCIEHVLERQKVTLENLF